MIDDIHDGALAIRLHRGVDLFLVDLLGDPMYADDIALVRPVCSRQVRILLGYFNVPIGLACAVLVNRVFFPDIRVPAIKMPTRGNGSFLSLIISSPIRLSSSSSVGTANKFTNLLFHPRSHGVAALMALCLVPAIATETMLSGLVLGLLSHLGNASLMWYSWVAYNPSNCCYRPFSLHQVHRYCTVRYSRRHLLFDSPRLFIIMMMNTFNHVCDLYP
ncbi:hypothetical protein AHF37_11683 [Paragonimus kellicotti]|nr:hypothetical protein AHF37_11683 [Paragonimus kellicotti]